MIEGHRVDALKLVEVVPERQIVAAPGDDVERRVIDLGFPESSTVTGNEPEVALTILERCRRCFEIARVRQTKRSDRSEIGKPQMLTVVLAENPRADPLTSSTLNLMPRGMTTI